jgi:hypothetical protein
MPSSTPSLPENHPLTMANLQQSARDILRGFENAMASTPISSASSNIPKSRRRSPDGTNPKEAVASFEQAFRSFFTSCTQGAAMATNDEEDEDGSLNPVEVALSNSSDCSIFSTPRSTPQRMSSNKDTFQQLALTKANPSNGALEHQEQKVAADHIYEHLFFAEEQARRAASHSTANTASSSQRPLPVSSGSRTTEVLPTKPPGVGPAGIHRRRMTLPFPMSTPPPMETQCLPTHSTPMTSPLLVSQNRTFDDDISAISAHTLEAMVTSPKGSPPLSVQPCREAPARVTPCKTTASALPPKKKDFCRASTLPRANNGRRDDAEPPSPILSRDSSSSGGQSYGNQSRKFHRNHSMSPNSSGTQSFDRWQSVEQEFWNSVVAEDNALHPAKSLHRKSRRRSVDGWSGSRSRTADSTLSGRSLSQRSSSWLGVHPQHHPHETFPFTIPHDDGLYIHPPSSSHRSFYDLTDSGEI